MLPHSDVDMRRKVSFFESFQQHVYTAATQAPYSALDACFRWSLVKLYRLIALFRMLLGQQNTLSRIFDELPKEEAHDRGVILKKTDLIYEAELELATNTSLAAEYASLRAPGAMKPSEICNRLWYKCCYNPSKLQGQSTMQRFADFLSIITAAHAGCSNLVKQADRRCTWQADKDTFVRMARDLQREESRANNTAIDWTLLGKHWPMLGFQGEDPSTDFRSTGTLGLHHLAQFCRAHPIYATRIIRESGTAATTSEGPWYPFALCAIHITSMLLSMIKRGLLQRHCLQAALRNPIEGVTAFSDELFSYLFVRCHLDWCEGVDKKEITSVLVFEAFFADFHLFMEHELKTKRWENDDFHVATLKWW